MRKRFFLLVLLPFLAVAETWLPPERPLPDLTDLAKRNEIVAESPALGQLQAGRICVVAFAGRNLEADSPRKFRKTVRAAERERTGIRPGLISTTPAGMISGFR